MRSTIPRTFVAVAIAAVITTACASSNDSSTEQTPTQKVEVMLDWSPNTNHAGMYLAKANGWYEDAGLAVRFLQPGGGGDVGQAVATGSVDFGVSAAEQVASARAADVPVVSIAALIEHNTSSLISLASEGISRPRDLEGRTYGGFGFAFENALVSQLVECDDGDPEEINFANIGEADYRDGLTRGQYDFVWVFDGWDVIKIRDLDGLDLDLISFIDHDDCIPDWYTPVLITNETKIADDPDLIKSFLEVTRRGYQAAIADPDAAATALLEAAPELDEELVRKSADYMSTHYADDPTQWGHQKQETWDAFIAFLIDHGIVDADFDVDAAFDDSLLPPER